MKIIDGITFFDINDLTKKLGIGKKTINTYLKNGKIEGKIFGRKWMVTEEQYQAFLKSADEPKQTK